MALQDDTWILATAIAFGIVLVVLIVALVLQRVCYPLPKLDELLDVELTSPPNGSPLGRTRGGSIKHPWVIEAQARRRQMDDDRSIKTTDNRTTRESIKHTKEGDYGLIGNGANDPVYDNPKGKAPAVEDDEYNNIVGETMISNPAEPEGYERLGWNGVNDNDDYGRIGNENQHGRKEHDYGGVGHDYGRMGGNSFRLNKREDSEIEELKNITRVSELRKSFERREPELTTPSPDIEDMNQDSMVPAPDYNAGATRTLMINGNNSGVGIQFGESEGGIIIAGVTVGSAASEIVHNTDIGSQVIMVNGATVKNTSLSDLSEALNTMSPEDSFTLTIESGQTKLEDLEEAASVPTAVNSAPFPGKFKFAEMAQAYTTIIPEALVRKQSSRRITSFRMNQSATMKVQKSRDGEPNLQRSLTQPAKRSNVSLELPANAVVLTPEIEMPSPSSPITPIKLSAPASPSSPLGVVTEEEEARHMNASDLVDFKPEVINEMFVAQDDMITSDGDDIS